MHTHHLQALTLKVTGNSGIGYETTLQLALHGARVYIAGRSPDRVRHAIEQMNASSANSLDLHLLEMDLQDLGSVKQGAEVFMKQESRLDLLINNAGVRQSASCQASPVTRCSCLLTTSPNADHGSPIQTNDRRLRNPMANQPSSPLSAY